MLLFILLGLLALVFIWVLIDFFRFRKAKAKGKKEAKAANTDAGGTIFVQGNRTYYNMPNGVRRKIADYPMDLNPGSADMNMFTGIMDQARKLAHEDAKQAKKQAINNIASVANDEAKL
jgi:hypothetical protein